MKNRGMLRITNRMIESMLGLPEEVKITEIFTEGERDVVCVKLTSQEPVEDYTYPVGEGAIIPQACVMWYGEVSDWQMRIYEYVRDQLIGTVPNEEEEEHE